MPTGIPSSKCPTCGRRQDFTGVAEPDTPTGIVQPLGPGAVIVCVDCATVLMLGTNLVLDVVHDRRFLEAAPIVEERQRVVTAHNLDWPPDLPQPDGHPTPPTPPANTPPGVVTLVEPPTSRWPLAYLTSRDRGWVMTGEHASVAEFLLPVVDDHHEALPPLGRSWTFGPDAFEMVCVPISDIEAVFAGLPDDALPDGARWVQVVAQDDMWRWPWEPDGPNAPIVDDSRWRPPTGPPTTITTGSGGVDRVV